MGGIEIVFVTLLSFTDFDECWDYYHEKIQSKEHAYYLCTPVEREVPPVRPRMRPEKPDE